MTKFPSWRCQKCGAYIGWLGRAFQILGLHKCVEPARWKAP